MLTPFPILSVSQLNKEVKSYLENELGAVHVEGEVSNLSKPASGHYYFTLKDSSAQIRCVHFKNRHQLPLISKLSNGQKIVANGNLSLYEARGDYQLIVNSFSEAGLGALYQRFEELKTKLAAEGLFHSSRKKSLPSLPLTLGIITSTSGAAIKDILATLARRFPLAQVLIYPSEVQGATAAQQLIKALQQANADQRAEVLILARGGGSIEDLWAFNDEQLARCIANSTIPVVSGVGHETDFTIADFVADYRAETPTAAANAVTPNSMELLHFFNHSLSRLHNAIQKIIQTHQLKLQHLIEKTSSPKLAIATFWQTIDYLERQLTSHIRLFLHRKKHQIQLHSTLLQTQNPQHKMIQTQIRVNQLAEQLSQVMHLRLQLLKNQLVNNMTTLQAVSPLATLDRGYAIATKGKTVILRAEQVQKGDAIQVRLAQGSIECEVN